MWQYVLLFAACACIGACLVMPTLPQMILTQLEGIPAMLQNIWAYLQSYGVTPIQLLSAVGGVATVGGLIIAKLKSSLSQTKAQAKQQLETTTAYATQQQQLSTDKIKTLEDTVKARDETISTLTTQVAGSSKSGEAYADLLTEKTNLETQLRDANQFISHITSPTDEEMIKRLKQNGYTVVQTVK